MLETTHESVLAFVREYAGSGTQFGDAPETILCVFSFAHNPSSATIDLGPEFAGAPVYDLFGGREFPAVDADGRVTLTLATQSFYWLHLGETGYQPAHL